MMNSQEVNTSIGCGVTECKYNRAGDYCTLRKIHVGNVCDCNAENVPAATVTKRDKFSFCNGYPLFPKKRIFFLFIRLRFIKKGSIIKSKRTCFI